MAVITWLDKIDGSDPGDPQKNVNAADMNQIKSVVNTNDANTATVQTNLDTHTALANNPHAVTKAQVGLSNVENIILASGISAFLVTPSSANLATAVTGETGSGALVFATSPTLVTPALGTPTALVLTNATGLPVLSLVGVLGIANGGNGTTNGISAETQAALNLKAGRDAFAIGVTPSGAINGVNTVFVLPQVPYSGSVAVYHNTTRLIEGIGYTIVTDTITFTTAPETGDNIICDYIRP